MARIMLLEFKETTRHVKGSVSITYHDRGAPQELTAVFPNTGRETYSNGILQISKLFLNKLSFLLIIDCFYDYRNAKVACHGSKRYRIAPDFHYWLPPVHRIPFTFNEAAIAQEDAQAGRSFRTCHYSSKTRPNRYKKLEGVARWHWRGRPRTWRRKETGWGLYSHKMN